MTARGLIVSAPRSGAGKTTVTLALLAALRRRGIAVQAAKAGPDYIDPAFHGAATGRDSVNLDSWAMPPSLLDGLMGDAVSRAEMLVVEGVMGLFDGIEAPRGRSGATAELASRFGLPVLLVIDVSGQSQSAAALVRGFAMHDPEVRIGGVVLNKIGSERHRNLVADAVSTLGIPIFGSIGRDASLALPERHLGLVQASEHGDLDTRLGRLADLAERHLDLDGIIRLAATPRIAPSQGAAAIRPPGMRIALAQDDAFTFVYPHLIAGWRREGAEIVPFSPLADEAPPDTCDVCWLPGGYPELHAGRLAAANRFRDGLARFAATRKVHGECGGYMVLGESLEDASGVSHAMTGLLGHATSFAERKLHLGYREARLLTDGPLGPEGSLVRGHEFHYASLTATGNDAPFAEITGTFFHAIATA
jgi:cobyrinic acid a,c-diamide synthase